MRHKSGMHIIIEEIKEFTNEELNYIFSVPGFLKYIFFVLKL